MWRSTKDKGVGGVLDSLSGLLLLTASWFPFDDDEERGEVTAPVGRGRGRGNGPCGTGLGVTVTLAYRHNS